MTQITLDNEVYSIWHLSECHGLMVAIFNSEMFYMEYVLLLCDEGECNCLMTVEYNHVVLYLIT